MKRASLIIAISSAAVLTIGGCSAIVDRDAGESRSAPTSAPSTSPPSNADAALVDLPIPASEPTADGDVAEARQRALINDVGQLALVDDGQIDDRWIKFRATPAPDRRSALLVLPPEIEGIGPERPVVWLEMPGGDQIAKQTMASDQELAATSLDGVFAGFTTVADDPGTDDIAGARTTSRITIVSRDDGTVFEQELAGNFVPEAFSRRMVGGIPAQVFLLEYFPADAPRFYRVRVLSTETGEVSLPLNLRNKQEQVDERMAGFTRSQVVAHDHGLLFTLYRGTLDGTPDGEPYAFVHTLDFADGVWCLEVDSALELDRYAGSLAVGGDRLYVASANGWVGSFPIPSITDPDLSPSMDWVVELSRPSDTPPALIADDDGAWVGPADGASRLIRIDTEGRRGEPMGLPGPVPQALDYDEEGNLLAVGAEWATFDLIRRADWLDAIRYLIAD